jgi:hypothetical protein
LPPGEGVVGHRDGLAGPVAPGAAGRGLLGRSRRGVGRDVLLQQPAGQLLAQLASPLLALRQGDQLVGPGGPEHVLEGVDRLADELTPQFGAFGRFAAGAAVHGRFSR